MANEIDLREYIDILIRRWQIVIAIPILTILTAALATFALPPVYQTTATLALDPSTISVSISTQAPPYYLLVDSPRNLPTAHTPAYYIALLNSPTVADQVTPRLPVSIASNSADKSLIEIMVRGGDPKLVAQVANAWAQAGANQIEKILQPRSDEAVLAKQQFDQAQQALDKFLQDNKIFDYDPALPPALPGNKRTELNQLSRARDLAESVYLDFARDLAREAILASSAYKPTIIPATVPDAPTSPKLAQNLLIGAVFGVLLGILGAFAIEWMTRRPVRK